MVTAVRSADLVEALKLSGWLLVGRGAGHVRLSWSGDPNWPSAPALLVPTDETAPEYAELTASVLLTLEDIVVRGEAALQVLERVGSREAS